MPSPPRNYSTVVFRRGTFPVIGSYSRWSRLSVFTPTGGSFRGTATSDRERNYMELLAHLEKARLAIGAVNPRFPYYERMIRQAILDDDALAELQERIRREGGLW